MFLTHSLFNNGKSQSMDISLRCVHALSCGIMVKCSSKLPGIRLAQDSGSAACILA